MHRTFAIALCVSSILACGETQTAATDAGVDEGAAACNQLTLPPSVAITAMSGTPAAAAGGTISDGTYVLTEVDDYNTGDAFAGQPAAGVLVVSGSTIDVARLGAKGDVSRYSVTFSVSGTTLVETGTCGLAMPLSEGFTATATSITLVDTSPAFVSVYTRM